MRPRSLWIFPCSQWMPIPLELCSTCHWRGYNPMIDFHTVPIIPSFLLQTMAPGAPALSSAALNITVFSYRDNTTRTTSDHTIENANETQRTHMLHHLPRTALPASNSCADRLDFLSSENVRVGLLFASKAMMQLIANPFVGPLTNRYARV